MRVILFGAGCRVMDGTRADGAHLSPSDVHLADTAVRAGTIRAGTSLWLVIIGRHCASELTVRGVAPICRTGAGQLVQGLLQLLLGVCRARATDAGSLVSRRPSRGVQPNVASNGERPIPLWNCRHKITL